MPAQLYFPPFGTAFNNNGAPIPGAKEYFFYSGTENLAPIYADKNLSTPLANPLVADLAARFKTVYLDSSIIYRVRVTSVDDTPLGQDLDPYIPGTEYLGPRGNDGKQGPPGGNTGSIGLFINSSGVVIPIGTDLARTSGYSSPGRGDANYAYDPSVNSAYVSSNPRTSFMAKATAAETTPSRGFRLVEKQPYAEMFGAVGDNSTDDFVALQAMLNYGGVVRLSAKTYFCSQRLEARRLVSFYGVSPGFDARKATYAEMPGSHIRFPANFHGIIFRPQWNEDSVTPATMPPEQEGAFGSVMDGISFLGGGGTAPVNGVEARTRVFITRCESIGFAQHGFLLWGSSDLADNLAPFGNTSSSGVTLSRAYNNGGSGFVFAGRDSSVMLVDGNDARENKLWGFEDTTIFGVTIIGPHSAGNSSIVNGVRVGGAYRSTSLVGVTTYVNPYTEGDVGGRIDVPKQHRVVGGGFDFIPNINPFPLSRQTKRNYTDGNIVTSSTSGFTPDKWSFDVRAGCNYVLRINSNYNHASTSGFRMGLLSSDGFDGVVRGNLFINTSETSVTRHSLNGTNGFNSSSSYIEATPVDGSPYYLPAGGEIVVSCTTSGTLAVIFGTANSSDSTIVPSPAFIELIET